MRDTLKTFTTESLEKASGALLKKLGIKYTPLVEGIPFDDYFEQNDFSYQYVKEAQKAIEHIWHIGYVNDATFIGEAANENNKAGASSINIFACEIKSEEYFPRGLAADLTRAFNRVSTRNVNFNYDMPVVVIMRQGRLLSIATCERSERADGLGEKVGKVTILRNMDCENLHAGHRQILERIAKDVSGSSSYEELHKKWFASFSIDVLSDKFFEGYKAIYEDIIEYVTGKRMLRDGNKWKEHDNGEPCKEIMSEFDAFPDPEKAVRDYVKNLMGRLVFIQFLQKKGWMGVPAGDSWEGGDPEFLQNLFKNSDKKETFIDDVLEPLFNDLNTKRHGDLVSSRKDIKVPYLNGGLFELDKSDDTKFPLPSSYMQKLLDFFASYNFTIDENAPDDVEIGVDPEMLGRIFENLLEDNKEKGAFYTPKEIVQYMCRESLIAYLTTRVMKKQGENHKPEKDIHDAVRKLLSVPQNIVPKMTKEHLEDFGTYIRDVKICDPAIGSGAFPMGLLNELVRCRTLINAWAVDSYGNELVGDIAALKAEIIRNNIYGVDIEKGAIDIARLRFWLSIIVDERTPEALPNFDYKFMQGNSLLPTFAGEYINLSTKNQKHVNVQKMVEVKKKIHQFKHRFYSASGDDKMKLNILIKDHILQLISLQLGYEIQSWADSHREQLSIFGEVEKVTVKQAISQLPEERRCIVELGRELRAKLADENISLERRSQIDIQFFDWRLMFTEVFDKQDGGFDIVIGNPPYIRIQTINSISPQLVPIYNEHYSDVASGNYDFYILFTSLGFSLLNRAGILAYIQPNKFMQGESGEKLRKKISDNAALLHLIDFGTNQVFNSATTYTCIIFLSRDRKNSFTYKKYDLGEDIWTIDTCEKLTIDEEFTKAKEGWNFSNLEISGLLNKIRNAGRSFEERTHRIFKGSSTGNDKIFLLDILEEKDNTVLVKSDIKTEPFEIEKNICRPFIYGEDVLRFSIPVTRKLLLFPYTKVSGKYRLYSINELATYYPLALSYLNEFKELLLSRKTRLTEDSFFKYSAARSLNEYEQFKILIPDMLVNCRVGLDPYGVFFTGPAIHCPVFKDEVNQYAYFAILNSCLFWFYISHTSTALRGNAYRLTPEFLNDFSFPELDIKVEKALESLVKNILQLNSEHRCDATSKLENSIDRIIYELYGLTNAEVKLIDPDEVIIGADDEFFEA